MNAANVRIFQANTAGRDFIVGDIHGAYDMVIKAMRLVRFDPARDRLFSVGDLIDRSAGSHRALEFLAKPYVHAVRGNHDDDFAGLTLQEMKVLGGVNWNGLGWVGQVDDEKLLALKAKMSTLPIAIEVQTVRGTVGLVHGDVPAGMHWQGFKQALQRGDEKTIHTALWGRDRLEANDVSGVIGVARLFVGHTIQWSGPRRLGNVYAIDSGAVFRELDTGRGSLTMANLMCHTGTLAPYVQEQVQALQDNGFVAVHTQEAEGPFGVYTAPAP